MLRIEHVIRNDAQKQLDALKRSVEEEAAQVDLRRHLGPHIQAAKIASSDCAGVFRGLQVSCLGFLFVQVLIQFDSDGIFSDKDVNPIKQVPSQQKWGSSFRNSY